MSKVLVYFNTNQDSLIVPALNQVLYQNYQFKRIKKHSTTIKLFLPQSNTKILPKPQNSQLYLLQGDHMSSLYSLIGNSDDTGELIQGDPELSTIILKLKNLWTHRQTAKITANESSDSVGSRVYIGELTIGSAFRGIILFANLKNLDANVWVSSILESIGSFGVDFKIYHNTDLNGQDEMEEAQLIMNMLKGGLL